MNHRRHPEFAAFRLLQTAFVVVPLVAGLDKFFYFLTDWSVYLAPKAVAILQDRADFFMMLVGVVEMIVAIGVIFKPKLFSTIIGIWLLMIIINLIIGGHFLDVALRDLGLMLSAFALGQLAGKYRKTSTI